MMKREFIRQKNDPEIKLILSDPTVMKVLENSKNDPTSIQRAMKTDSELRRKFEILIASGIFSQKEEKN